MKQAGGSSASEDMDKDRYLFSTRLLNECFFLPKFTYMVGSMNVNVLRLGRCLKSRKQLNAQHLLQLHLSKQETY